MTKPGDTIGPYSLISKLGRGAFGVVWLAEKRTAIATTRVAIKIPNDDDIDLEAVKNEAALWVHASGHPNVLPIVDADIYDGQVIIVSEYAPDGSLSKWLETHGGRAPSIESAVEITLGILAGLEHLHERGIIHRDLKPDNILLQSETPRLADFGIARVLKTTSSATSATGTPAYMSPEAFDGKRSERTDIWSVGVVFYQLLTGRLPFPQTEITSLVGAILTREPEPFSETVPSDLKQIIIRALDKDPNNRFESVVEMRRALRVAHLSDVRKSSNAETIVLPSTDTQRPSLSDLDEHKPKTKTRAWYFGIGVLLLLITILAFVKFTQKPTVVSPETQTSTSPSPEAQTSASPGLKHDNSAQPSTGNDINPPTKTSRTADVQAQISKHKAELIRLMNRRDELLTKYTPAYPEVKVVNKEIADIQEKIRDLEQQSSR